MNQDHGVLLPRFAGRLVAHPTPQVDHLLAAVVHATGATQLVARREVFGERIAHGLEAGAHVPLDADGS